MQIIAFVAKDVGLACTKFLLENFPQDEYLFVACEPNQQEIVDYLNQKQANYIIYSKQLIKDTIEENRNYLWLLNLWSSTIFPQQLLDQIPHNLNIHPSFLPDGRGSDPIVWSIRDKQRSGVTLHQMISEVDAGPIWYQEQIEYEFPISGEQLYKIVIDKCISAFIKHWPEIRQLNYKLKIQSELQPEHKRKQLLSDRIINATRPTTPEQLIRRILAHDFQTNGYTAQVSIDDVLYNVTINLKKQ